VGGGNPQPFQEEAGDQDEENEDEHARIFPRPLPARALSLRDVCVQASGAPEIALRRKSYDPCDRQHAEDVQSERLKIEIERPLA
jgi:hypothetical protein